MVCILTIILTCPNLGVGLLNASHATLAFTDTYTTQRNFMQCREIMCESRETNPLTRPFQSHGKPLAYASTYTGLVGASYLASRMRQSNRKWVRALSWLPQASLSAASVWGINKNLHTYNSALLWSHR